MPISEIDTIPLALSPGLSPPAYRTLNLRVYKLSSSHKPRYEKQSQLLPWSLFTHYACKLKQEPNEKKAFEVHLENQKTLVDMTQMHTTPIHAYAHLHNLRDDGNSDPKALAAATRQFFKDAFTARVISEEFDDVTSEDAKAFEKAALLVTTPFINKCFDPALAIPTIPEDVIESHRDQLAIGIVNLISPQWTPNPATMTQQPTLHAQERMKRKRNKKSPRANSKAPKSAKKAAAATTDRVIQNKRVRTKAPPAEWDEATMGAYHDGAENGKKKRGPKGKHTPKPTGTVIGDLNLPARAPPPGDKLAQKDTMINELKAKVAELEERVNEQRSDFADLAIAYDLTVAEYTTKVAKCATAAEALRFTAWREFLKNDKECADQLLNRLPNVSPAKKLKSSDNIAEGCNVRRVEKLMAQCDQECQEG